MRAPPFQPVKPRLESKSTFVPFCGCQIWFGPSVPHGYGVLSVNGRQTYAHRASWVLEHGEIPGGLYVLHKCDTPACINVDHLFLGSARDNTKDMVKKNRGNYANHARGKDHYFYGNGYKGENHPGSKLNQSQVDEIRNAYKPGVRQIDLASKYGVKQACISSIVRGKSWA